MSLKDDIASETIVEFEVNGQKGFKYKPVTAGEENDWLPEYMVPDKDGKIKQDFSKLNKCKIRNLVEVGYTPEEIRTVFGIDKSWKNMTQEERWELIRKLKPSIFDEIIRNINKIDAPSKKKS